MRKKCLLLVFAIVLMLAGCAHNPSVTAPQEPEWIRSPYAGYQDDSDVLFTRGVVEASAINDIQLVEDAAREAGYLQLAQALEVTIKNLFKNFVENHRDMFDMDNTAETNRMIEQSTKSIVDATIRGGKAIEYWEDKANSRYYARMKLNLNDSFWNMYQDNVKNLLKKRHRAETKAKAVELEKQLDSEIEKQRQNQKEIFGY